MPTITYTIGSTYTSKELIDSGFKMNPKDPHYWKIERGNQHYAIRADISHSGFTFNRILDMKKCKTIDSFVLDLYQSVPNTPEESSWNSSRGT